MDPPRDHFQPGSNMRAPTTSENIGVPYEDGSFNASYGDLDQFQNGLGGLNQTVQYEGAQNQGQAAQPSQPWADHHPLPTVHPFPITGTYAFQQEAPLSNGGDESRSRPALHASYAHASAPASSRPTTALPAALRRSLPPTNTTPAPSIHPASAPLNSSGAQSLIQHPSTNPPLLPHAAANTLSVTSISTTTSPVPIASLLRSSTPSSHPGFSVYDIKEACELTNSKPFGPYMTISKNSVPLSGYSKVSLLPKYEARQSVNDLRAIAAQGDMVVQAKLQKFDEKSKSRNKMTRTDSRASSEDEEEDEESFSDEELGEQFPLSPDFSTTPLKAAEYKAAKAVWHTEKTYINDEVLSERLNLFAELFFPARDAWKAKNETLKQATEQKETSTTLIAEVQDRRQLIEATLKGATEHGHIDILNGLGNNLKLLAAFQYLLLEQIKGSDQNGTLSRSIIKMLFRFMRIKTESLEITKLGKTLLVLAKKGDKEIKDMVKTVLARATENSTQQMTPAAKALETAAPAGDSNVNGSSKASKAAVAANLTTTKRAQANAKPDPDGLKRSRASELASTPGAKRLAPGPAATKPSTIPSASSKRPISTIGSKSTANVGQSAMTAKAKVQAASAPKAATNFFSRMQPTEKKPSTTGTPAKPTVVASVRPAFSLEGIVAGIGKSSMTEVKTKPEVKKPPETEAEKVKRLRKESRRGLRVSWKPDAELVAVRIFSHDPTEETGHDANMVRDVANQNLEGRMFKQLYKPHGGVEGYEEENSESIAGRTYFTPSEIDFSDIHERIRTGEQKDAVTRRGGFQEPESPDREEQEKREAITLMSVYCSRDDIPPRPHSPVDPYTGPKIQTATMMVDDYTLYKDRKLRPWTVPPGVDPDPLNFGGPWVFPWEMPPTTTPTPGTGQSNHEMPGDRPTATPAPGANQPTVDVKAILEGLKDLLPAQQPPTPSQTPFQSANVPSHGGNAQIPDLSRILALASQNQNQNQNQPAGLHQTAQAPVSVPSNMYGGASHSSPVLPVPNQSSPDMAALLQQLAAFSQNQPTPVPAPPPRPVDSSGVNAILATLARPDHPRPLLVPSKPWPENLTILPKGAVPAVPTYSCVNEPLYQLVRHDLTAPQLQAELARASAPAPQQSQQPQAGFVVPGFVAPGFPAPGFPAPSFVPPGVVAPSSVAPNSVPTYENQERKRMREATDDYNGRNDAYSKRTNSYGYQNNHEGYNARSNGDGFQGRNEGFNGRNNTDRPYDRSKPKYTDDNNPKKFLLPCSFWARGECKKGAKCTYRHDA